MSDRYYFRYVFPPGADADAFPDLAAAALRGVPHEIRRKDWDAFVAYRVTVQKGLESTAAFRLFPFKLALRSEGPTSAHHVSVRPSWWLHERGRRKPPDIHRP